MDLVLGIVSIILSVIVFVVSFNYDNYMYDVVGGGGFPKMLAVIIILCSLVIIGQHFAEKKHKKPKEETNPGRKGNNKAAVSLTVGVLAYILALETVGYLVCTVILTGFLLWVQKVRKPRVLLTATCTICGFLYVIFVLVLKVKLPTGFLI